MSTHPNTSPSPLPTIADDPAHLAVVQMCSRLHPHEIEKFLFRLTRNRTTMFFLREVLAEFMPRKRNPNYPRAFVWRNGAYWFSRTRECWRAEHEITRRQLEVAYRQGAAILEVDHFMFGAQRRTHYHIKFNKLRELLEQDPVLRDRLGHFRRGGNVVARVPSGLNAAFIS